MQMYHSAKASSFVESGFIDRYLKERQRYFNSACQFIISEQETPEELTRSALSHAYQQGWISITQFQQWNSQLAD
ncbi:hypothetical protein [Celerinatantimonas sp. YJH-8]|uniref:hypothetical protein n=1 Tax=Celerinatantimonas sp. YJH-8 TaxID=3228714 RepID=UPI0038C44777